MATGTDRRAEASEQVEPSTALELRLTDITLLVAPTDIGVLALLILLLAGFPADVGAAVPGERGALAAVRVDVELERVAGEVVLQVVAAHNGQRDAGNGLVGSVTPPVVCGLLADVGRLGRARRRGGCGRCGRRGDEAGRAGGGDGRGRGDFDAGRLVLVPASLLVALGRAGAGAVTAEAELLDLDTPSAELEALLDAGPSGQLEAGCQLKSACLGGIETSLLVGPVGQRRRAPVAGLEFAMRGRDLGGSAGGCSRGGCSGSGCAGGGGGDRRQRAGRRRGLVAAGFGGVQILGIVKVQTLMATADHGVVALARDVALVGITQDVIRTKIRATPTFA